MESFDLVVGVSSTKNGRRLVEVGENHDGCSMMLVLPWRKPTYDGVVTTFVVNDLDFLMHRGDLFCVRY